LEIFYKCNNPNNIILQVDTDEFPVFESNLNDTNVNSVNRSLINMLVDNKCDVVYGKLLDAISTTRKLINITWDIPLDRQFSSYCDAKKHVEHAVSNKLILYRAIHRPLPGNHRLRCENSKFSLEDCNKNNNTMIPKITKKPRSCRKYLKVKHYKYVWGIEEYLNNRAQVFKKAHIPWYKESLQALNYLHHSNGTIC
jgi:hypothetical protein